MQKVESDLLLRLQEDKELAKDKEQKMLFLSYANQYDSDLLNNLKLTSLELDAKYNTMNPSSWLRFVKYPIVKKYIDGYLDESSEKAAQTILAGDAGKPRDALRIKQDIYEKRKGQDNSNIVVLFMPQRNYVGED